MYVCMSKMTSITTLTFQFHILRPADNSCNNLGSIYLKYNCNLQVSPLLSDPKTIATLVNYTLF